MLRVSPPSRNSPCLIISSLDATVGRVLDMIVKMSNGDEEQKKAQRETIEQFRELINADTLRTMQLLGFNYKAAIGEPPTRLCADKMSSSAINTVLKIRRLVESRIGKADT